MKSLIFLIVGLAVLSGGCTGRTDSVQGNGGTVWEADSVPRATAILWIDLDKSLPSGHTAGKTVVNVKAKVNISSDGKVQVLEYVSDPSGTIERYIAEKLENDYRVKQKFFDKGLIEPGVQYVFLRLLKEKL